MTDAIPEVAAIIEVSERDVYCANEQLDGVRNFLLSPGSLVCPTKMKFGSRFSWEQTFCCYKQRQLSG